MCGEEKKRVWFSVATEKTVGVSFGTVNGKLVKAIAKSHSWATPASYIAFYSLFISYFTFCASGFAKIPHHHSFIHSFIHIPIP